MPARSAPLLVVRDPVVSGIYTIALTKGIFPFNRFVVIAIMLAILSLAASLFVFGQGTQSAGSRLTRTSASRESR